MIKGNSDRTTVQQEALTDLEMVGGLQLAAAVLRHTHPLLKGRPIIIAKRLLLELKISLQDANSVGGTINLPRIG